MFDLNQLFSQILELLSPTKLFPVLLLVVAIQVVLKVKQPQWRFLLAVIAMIALYVLWNR